MNLMLKTYYLNDILINDLSLEETAELILKPSKSSNAKTVHTINVDHIYKLANSQNKKFIQSYKTCDLVTLDSRVVKLIVKIKYKEHLNLCTGSDLTETLFKKLQNHKDKKVYILGGDKHAAQNLINKYQLSCDVKQYIPPMGFINKPDEFSKCANFIEEFKPNIVFLALGCPQQEILAQYLKNNASTSSYYLCIGASIDFLTGKQRRAPKLIQKLHLEWAFRIFQSPMRMLKRYLSNFKILNQIKYRKAS